MRTKSEQGFWRETVSRLSASCGVAALFLFLSSVNSWAQQSGTQAGAAAQENRAAESSGQAGTSRIDESLLVGLPLNGRSYSQLATLEAGVSDPSAASASRGTSGGNLNVNGSRASSNSFLLDGTNIMD